MIESSYGLGEAQVHFAFHAVDTLVSGFAVFSPVFLLRVLRSVTRHHTLHLLSALALKDTWSVLKMQFDSVLVSAGILALATKGATFINADTAWEKLNHL